MQATEFLATVPPQLHFDAGLALLLLVLRWTHVLAGIVWLGFLYFFTFVTAPLLASANSSERVFLVSRLMPRALWWFRWSAVLTVFVGVWYWMYTVSADARNAGASGGHAIGTFFALWTLAFIVEMGALMSPAEILRKPAALGLIVAVLVALASYYFVVLNQHGWESNRLLAIGIGGGLGWFMMFNVWGVFWRMQKKIIRWVQANPAENELPPEIARAVQLARLTARVNFYLSFPMLLFMVIAPHYHIFTNIE